jgi:hypothetical protein
MLLEVTCRINLRLVMTDNEISSAGTGVIPGGKLSVRIPSGPGPSEIWGISNYIFNQNLINLYEVRAHCRKRAVHTLEGRSNHYVDGNYEAE